MNTRIITLLIIAGIVLLWLWRTESQHDETRISHATKQAHRADHILSDLSITIMNEAGKPYYRLNTPNMRHYMDDDTTEMQTPELYFYREDAAPIQAQSELGRITAKGEQVHLLGDVVINQLPDETHSAVKVNTRDLIVLPQAKTAHSDHDITAIADIYSVNGHGLSIDFKSGLMQIKSKTRAMYEP